MRWRGMETPDAVATTRYRFPRVWAMAGTPVGAKKTSVGIQSGIQGWRFSIGKRGKLATAYGNSCLTASWPSNLAPNRVQPASRRKPNSCASANTRFRAD